MASRSSWPDIVFLVLLLALAIYGLVRSVHLALPIPKAISAFMVTNPLLIGLTIFYNKHNDDQSAGDNSQYQRVAITLLLQLQAAIGGVVLTYTTQSFDLDCPLSQRWQALFTAKDAHRIRAIQETFNCCGFRTVRDRPFPFPSAHEHIDDKTCSTRFARTKSCLADWRASEQRTAVLFLVLLLLGMVHLWIVNWSGVKWVRGWREYFQPTTRADGQRSISFQENEYSDDVRDLLQDEEARPT